jgi:hypothetical protein
MGFRLGLANQHQVDDDKETTPTTSDEKLSQTDIMLDFEFGTDLGDMEFATYFTFGMTPGTINSLLGAAPSPHGTFTGEYASGGASTKDEGKASRLSIALETKARANKGLFFFDNSYAIFGFAYQGGANEYTAANTKIEDESDGQFAISSTYKMFNNTSLAEDKIFLVYGLGGSMAFSRTSAENKLSGSESTDTDMSFGIVAPTLNIGLEAILKYAKLRFGMERQLTTLGFTSSTSTYKSGLVDDEDTYSEFVLGGNGVYTYNAGMGFSYGNLQLDILVNNNFWIMGPQMIFSGDPATYGTLGVCADLVYIFNK